MQTAATELPVAKPTNDIGHVGDFLQLQWMKGAGADWCLLEEVDVAAVDDHGVFVVWRPGDIARAPAVLYVGRGPLRQKIEDCRRDPIMGGSPGLRITWARVDPRDVDAVAAYLYQQLRPLWGEVLREEAPQPVNLPLTG
jgi:hypothetical protein